jgi:hypothetical protein
VVPLKKMIHEGSLYFHPFNDTLQLAEVILGQRCTLSLHAVRTLTDAHHKNVVTTNPGLHPGIFRSCHSKTRSLTAVIVGAAAGREPRIAYRATVGARSRHSYGLTTEFRATVPALLR